MKITVLTPKLPVANVLTGNLLTPEDNAIMDRMACRLFLGAPNLTRNLTMYHGTPNL